MSRGKGSENKAARNVVGIRLTDDELARLKTIVDTSAAPGLPVRMERATVAHALLLRGMSIVEAERKAAKK